MLYFALKFLHVVGAAVLLGTGAGIAFFMLLAHRSNNPVHISGTARTVVIADFVFTATAVVAQPVTGVALVHVAGYSFAEHWIILSIALYIVTGLFWLPVVWMQMQMRVEAEATVRGSGVLTDRYHRLFRTWFAFGFPAFGSVIAIFWLMITRPAEIW